MGPARKGNGSTRRITGSCANQPGWQSVERELFAWWIREEHTGEPSELAASAGAGSVPWMLDFVQLSEDSPGEAQTYLETVVTRLPGHRPGYLLAEPAHSRGRRELAGR